MDWDRRINIMNMFSNAATDTVNDLGLIIAGIMAIHQIVVGKHTVGSFAMLM